MSQTFNRVQSRQAVAVRPLSATDTLVYAAAAIIPIVILLWALWMATVWLTQGI